MVGPSSYIMWWRVSVTQLSKIYLCVHSSWCILD